MRVIAGTARRLPLKTPAGTDVRPTTDRIKETLFNILQGDVGDSVFVDLFSGSGGIGIEALSRGAKKAYFVEHDKRTAGFIRENLAFTRLADRAVVLQQDVFYALYQIREQADLIFMDPPYDQGLEQQVLQRLREADFVTEDTQIIIESSLDTEYSWLENSGFLLLREKRYKTNKHVFVRRA